MAFDEFKAKPMQRLTASLWNSLMEALNGLDSNTKEELLKRVMYEDLGKLAYSIIPDEADSRDLGSSDKTWRAIYAKSGEFTDSLAVQGKQVIKDGDPVGISDISDTVKTKITSAIDNALLNQVVQNILSKLNVDLSTRASESTLNSILQSLDEIGVLALIDYTTSPLNANGSWTSTVDSDTKTGRIVGSVYADVSGTLYVEQSPDGSSWDIADTYNITGNSGVKFSVEKVCPYARVKYVNGSSDQTTFRLYVYRRTRVV